MIPTLDATVAQRLECPLCRNPIPGLRERKAV